MSDSGSDIRIASGSMKLTELHDENQVHQQHGDAERGEDLPEHFLLRLASPPSVNFTPGGIVSLLTRAMMSAVTSPVARPDVLACTEMTARDRGDR